MKKYVIASLGILLISCYPAPNNKVLTYQNIIILADMSSRLKNQKPKDVQEIGKLVEFFRNKCVKPGEKIGDRSSISFSTFSGKVATSVDLERFKSISEKQAFINSTGKFAKTGLDAKLHEFKNKVAETYRTTQNPGLDLISMLLEKIENEPIIKLNSRSQKGSDTLTIKFENHIHIFTDGYLEYAGKSYNSQFYFGEPEINELRRYSLANNLTVAQALFKDRSLGLPPVRRNSHKFISLHVHETHERDKNRTTNTYSNPIGFRDNEILMEVWLKWARESGFKDLKWSKY